MENDRGVVSNEKERKKGEKKKREKKEEGEEILDVRGKSWAAESNVSRRAKGVLASKTNSYPQSPLSAVFFADNLLLAA